MKKVFLLLSFVLYSVANFAQTQTTSNVAAEATAKLKEVYRLDDAQTKKMEVIQAHKVQNLEEVQKYKTTNFSLYVRKLQAITTGTNGSIERLLNKEQLVTFHKKQADLRAARAKKMQELKASKTSETQKQYMLWELEKQF